MVTKKGSGAKGPEKYSAGGFNAATLQGEIDSAGASWTAGQTPLSLLSADEQQARLGLVVSDDEITATAVAIQASEQLRAVSADFAAPPPSVDWRNKGGNWVTSIKDQETCGACVSFAVLATIEARLNIVCNNPALDMDLSEAHLFYCGCGNCCGGGWNFAPALDFCKNNGVGLDSSFRYTPGNQPCPPGVPVAMKITNWTRVFAIVDRKNILATKGPMVAGMRMFQDFFSYQSGVYRHVSGAERGKHAVCIVGYDDAQQCWIAKNSWNTSWGEDGFFKIGYGECGIDSEFAFYDLDVSCPTAAREEEAEVPCTQYIAVLKQALLAAQSNVSLRRCLRYYVCGLGARPLCSAAVMRVVNAVLAILEQCPEFREPFCRVLR